MAPLHVPSWYPLRSVTQRLSSTPAVQLPHIVPSLALTISTCGALLAEVDGQSNKKSQSDAAVVIHKLKTQISTLLQDKSRDARWSAVVLVKAIIEAGGWAVLKESEKWVRLLLALIGRPDPLNTKKLSIITLTRIFLLTQDYPALIREIATPSLPTFITSSLRSFSDSKDGSPDPLLSIVLWAFGELLPYHPSAFRPFVGQIRALVLPLTAPTRSSPLSDDPTGEVVEPMISEPIVQRARQVFVLLNGCAPKNAQSQEWAQTLSALIEKTHETADLVFRALLEDWEPSAHSGHPRTTTVSNPSMIVYAIREETGLPGWIGIGGGLERLTGLLMTLRSYLLYPSPSSLAFPVGKLMDVVDRILSALPPSIGGPQGATLSTRTNPEIGRDECEAVWAWLPHLHVSALSVLEQVVARLEQDSMAIDQQILSLVLWIFEKEHFHNQIRLINYRLLAQVLARRGSGLPRSSMDSVAFFLKLCCEDLMPTEAGPGLAKNSSNDSTTITTTTKDAANADEYLKRSAQSPRPSAASKEMRHAAESLLAAALSYLPPKALDFSLRSRIDQTAILSQSRLILHSSVLNPPASRRENPRSSIIPLLARQYPQSLDTEALVRPRMPMTQPSTVNQETGMDQEFGGEHETPEGLAYQHRENLDVGMEDPPPASVPEKPEAPLLESGGTVAPQTQDKSSLNLMPDEASEVSASNIPAKRPLDAAAVELEAPSLQTSERLSTVDSERPSKRIRGDAEDADPVQITETGLSKPITAPETEQANSPPADAAANTEPLANFGIHTADAGDDDSDDSSIPELDPTMDTEDEEEEGDQAGIEEGI
ncbi:MAG: hypothetical protein Q9218_003588 [Villophora microphyllina]